MSLRRRMFVAFGLLVLCCALICTSASGGASTFGTYSDYSSSLHPVIATVPVRIRIPEEERPHLLDDALYTSIVGYRTLDYLAPGARRGTPRFSAVVTSPRSRVLTQS
jgi:hypothetical protein